MVQTRDELPGADLIEAGLADLGRGVDSIPALLVSIGAPRLQLLGLAIEHPFPDAERRLYDRLAAVDSDAAHSRYNALVRRLVSFERDRMRQAADADRIRRFMQALGAEAAAPGRVYFSGKATAVLLGWRVSAGHADLKFVPERDRLFRAVAALKERLQINVELASPVDFIPVKDGWEDRSPFVAQEGRLSFHHFDLHAQALAKIERGHTQDLTDVQEMLRRGLVDGARLWEYFHAIEPQLYRYPAVDAPSFRAALEELLGPAQA